MKATAKIIPPTPTPRRVVLEMDETDAIVLQTVLGGHVGGSPNGPRGSIDRIYYALDSVGIFSRNDLVKSGCVDMKPTWPADLSPTTEQPR